MGKECFKGMHNRLKTMSKGAEIDVPHGIALIIEGAIRESEYKEMPGTCFGCRFYRRSDSYCIYNISNPIEEIPRKSTYKKVAIKVSENGYCKNFIEKYSRG